MFINAGAGASTSGTSTSGYSETIIPAPPVARPLTIMPAELFHVHPVRYGRRRSVRFAKASTRMGMIVLEEEIASGVCILGQRVHWGQNDLSTDSWCTRTVSKYMCSKI
jgi:hypothetical protein